MRSGLSPLCYLIMVYLEFVKNFVHPCARGQASPRYRAQSNASQITAARESSYYPPRKVVPQPLLATPCPTQRPG
jgi:hypothetical protein